MSAYRAPSPRPGAALAVACARCGAIAEVAAEEPAFLCASCGTDQLTAREEASAPASPIEVITFHEHDTWTALEPFTRELGLTKRCDAVVLRCAGIRCVVSLVGDGESTPPEVRSLSIAATPHGAPFPPVTFRSETAEDARSKAENVTREVQTGDVAFDADVFLDSEAADDDVHALLASVAARHAIRTLLRSFQMISVAASGLSASGSTSFSPADVREALGAMRVLAGAPRRLQAGPRRTASRAHRMAMRLSTASLLGFPLWLGVAHSFPPLATFLPLAVGVVPGLLAWFALQRPLKRAVSGLTTSSNALLLVRSLLFVGLPFLSIALVWFANAMLDGSPARVREFTIAMLEAADDSNTNAASARCTAREPGVGEQRFTFDDPGDRLRVGQSVTVRTKRGALGFEWQSSPAEVHLANGAILTQ